MTIMTSRLDPWDLDPDPSGPEAAWRTALGHLAQAAEERAAGLADQLRRARAEAHRLRDAATHPGSLVDLLARCADDELAAVAPHLDPAGVACLLGLPHTRARREAVTAAVTAACRRTLASSDDVASDALDSMLAAVLRPGPVPTSWAGPHRFSCLAGAVAAGPADEVRSVLTAAAGRAPSLAVFLGLHLAKAPGALRWVREPWGRELLGSDAAAYVRVGRAFCGALTGDPALELDMVDLLATMSPIETAAKVAESMTPLRSGSAVAAAQRVADLDTMLLGLRD